MIVSGIYKILNIVTGKFYIGSSSNISRRWNRHDNDFKNGENSKYLQKSWEKYGENNFTKEIVEILTKYDEETKKSFDRRLKEREQYYLDTLKSYTKEIGYNLSSISQGADFPHTNEAKIKISASKKERKMSEETKIKLSEINKGRKHSEETKEKIKRNSINNPNFGTKGKKMSEETKKKMREKKIGKSTWNKGIKCADSTKKKISTSKKGKKIPEKTRIKMRNQINKKTVYNIYEDGKVIEFQSIREAERITGIPKTTISNYCKSNKKINNFTWTHKNSI
jgi:hypothetical protein